MCFWGERKITKAACKMLVKLTDFLQNVTMNFHHWCLTQENFTKFEMEKFWSPLATGSDFDGLEFIAAMEAKDYPIW